MGGNNKLNGQMFATIPARTSTIPRQPYCESRSSNRSGKSMTPRAHPLRVNPEVVGYFLEKYSPMMPCDVDVQSANPEPASNDKNKPAKTRITKNVSKLFNITFVFVLKIYFGETLLHPH